MKSTILIDPGHGGKDNGAEYGYAEEDDTNLSIAYLLRCELQQRGYIVRMTREKDEFVSLSGRVNLANEMRADLFVSIHCDAFHKATAQGMTTHIHPNCSKMSREISHSIQTALSSKFSKHKNRGVRESNFYVLRETKMPAVLCEMEFLSNPDTRKFLREPENQLELARAITAGINGSILGGRII